MSNPLRILFYLCIAFLPIFGECASATTPSVRIALISDGPSGTMTSLRSLAEQEIRQLLEPEYQVFFASTDKFTGHWTYESVMQAIDAALEDPQVDVVVGYGVLSSYLIAQRDSLPKLAFAPFIIDAELQELPLIEGGSGVENLSYLTFPTDVSEDLILFHRLAPFSTLAVLTTSTLEETLPDIADNLEKITQKLGAKMQLVAVGSSPENILQNLPIQTDAAYLLPQLQLDSDQQENLIQRLLSREIPTFAVLGRSAVEQGALATRTPDTNIQRVTRRLALHIQAALQGENIAQLPVGIDGQSQLTINMGTVRRLHLHPPWELLVNAELLNTEATGDAPNLTLMDAVSQALVANRSLQAARSTVRAGQHQVESAAAPLRPQLEISSLTRAIDPDRAAGSFGLEPQSAWYGSASAQQVLYSNKLRGQYSVEQRLQRARCEEYKGSYLDTVSSTTIAYLNLLRARTLERIQRNNLRLTQTNLRIAKQREAVGEARASEVYRWESEIASNRSTAINAYYQVRNTEISLNRLRNTPQQERIAVEEVSLEDPYWLLGAEWFSQHVQDEQQLNYLSQFAVCEGLRLSPEVQQIRHQLNAQAEALGVANRAFWTPDVILRAEVRERLAEGGKGVKGTTIPGLGVRVDPLGDRTDWQLGLNVRFPLYEGGGKSAEKRKAYQQLQAASQQLQATAELIEQNIRSSIFNATASYAAIELARASASAAHKNLTLVTEAYARGATTIVDLIDAQNQALISDLISANAVYDFLIDLVQVQRSIGRFDFLMAHTDKQRVLSRLNQYIPSSKTDGKR